MAAISRKCNRFYNRAYTLRAMPSGRKSIECRERGSMSARDDEECKSEGEDAAKGGSESAESLLGRCYEICIGAQLDASWSEWFEGLEMHRSGERWTILCGRVADQAALLGILNKLSRLNLPLVSVNEVKESKYSHDADPEGGE
jgi:hypothetical protein